MGPLRSSFQGVGNILRFNWRQYGTASFAIVMLGLASGIVTEPWSLLCIIALVALAIVILVSVLVSHYIYDRSGLYKFPWLDQLGARDQEIIVNITAGFDETSALLRTRYPRAIFHVLDFYDAKRHTEPSLQAARRSHPPAPETKVVTSANLFLATESVDKIFVIFSAHEIRNSAERTVFFRELHRILKPDGCLMVMEHLRNFPNILAYTIGSLHFYTRATWRRAFADSALMIHREVACTAFVSTFILKKHGLPS